MKPTLSQTDINERLNSFRGTILNKFLFGKIQFTKLFEKKNENYPLKDNKQDPSSKNKKITQYSKILICPVN